MGEVAHGGDPAGKRQELRHGLTVAELCDLYLAEGATTKKSSTLDMDRSRIERHVRPLLGHAKVTELTREDVERFMRDIAAGRTAGDQKTGRRGRSIVKGGRGAASRTVGMLGGILTFAVEQKIRPDNPVRGVKRYKDRKMERFLSPAELARLGEALREAEAAGMNPNAVAAIRLLVFTGCRRDEILGLRWSHVDFGWGCLRLPDSKTGERVVHLGLPALELLRGLPKFGGDYVFPSGRGDGRLVGLQKAWANVRQAAGIQDVRLHDLRHSFAAMGAAGGDSLLVIGKLLGHKTATATARYAHLADDPVRDAADRVSGRIAAVMNGQGGEVVNIRRAK